MDARNPVRPGWPPVQVTSAGLGFAVPLPLVRRSMHVDAAQRTRVVDGALLVARVMPRA